MEEYRNLSIIGTSHIAKQSLDEVKEAIEKKKPDVIALELDKQRLYALMSSKKEKVRLYNIFKIGFKGFLFSLIGAWAEKKLGEYVGVMPGSEMKQAVRLARKNKIELALIDQNIEITLRRLSKSITWKEKWNFIVDVFKAVALRKREVEFDLRTVPSKKIIKKLVGKVKKRYPNIYKVLIEERNKVMAKKLVKLMKMKEDKKILAVMGAGHEDEIIDMVKKGINKVDVSYSISVDHQTQNIYI
ncbi:TraB/GumN family protein [Candidatus Woesearchaeota archaeon]|nr:TraB/GumN family protein [Candidatus Woesearchaeota archaeon]